jgi:hypothetical protein
MGVNSMADFLSWWDGVELWLTGRGFVLQTIVVMPIVLLLAYGVAVIADGLLGRSVGLLRRVRHLDGDDERAG